MGITARLVEAPGVEALIGTTLGGRYHIGSVLGSGGMGHVLAGTRVADGTPVALKLLKPEVAGNTREMERFCREVRLLSTLDHPNVLRFLDAGRLDSGHPILVTELLEGKTLHDVMKQRGRIPYRHFMYIGTCVLNGLAYIHGRGIVHRDLKPANIFLVALKSGKGTAKLLDFGLSLEPESGQERLTLHGRVAGTMLYLAPEQALGGEITPATDVYAFGIMAYRALTGRHPFTEARTIPTMVAAHVNKIPPTPDWQGLGIPQELGDLVMQCVEKKPADRPHSAAWLRDKLFDLSGR